MTTLMDASAISVRAGRNDRRPVVSPVRLLVLVVPAALVVGGAVAVLWPSAAALRRSSDQSMLQVFGLTRGIEHRLSSRYADTDGDLVADPPRRLADLRSPDTLVFSYVATERDADYHRTSWQELVAALAGRTGRNVDHVVFASADEQLQALRDGELHVTGFNTGSVPRAVNVCGFVPVCTLGRVDGSWGITTQIIVPQGSPVQTVLDLKGRKLTFTDTMSNSGFKAPVVILWKDFGLAPGRDYEWGFSYDHYRSIRGVSVAHLQAAAVASDMLTRANAAPEESRHVSAANVRVIHTSERFPPASLGHAHDLAPELAEAIRETLLEFSWAGTGLETALGPDVSRFVPVSYKDDFAIIRRIDDSLNSSYELK